MTLTDVGDLLRATPHVWRDIPPADRAVVEASLLPRLDGFGDDQRFWFARWWLACTQADVDAINALLPHGTRVEPINVAGSLFLCSDLLTDSLANGQRFFAVKDLVQGLICTYFAAPPPAPVNDLLVHPVP